MSDFSGYGFASPVTYYYILQSLFWAMIAFTHTQGYTCTMQLRYKQTTHTPIICDCEWENIP